SPTRCSTIRAFAPSTWEREESVMNPPLLAVSDLSVYYDAFRAVHDLTVHVAEGEIVSVIGANGAGKSSFLKAILNQVGRTEGAIQFQGKDITRLHTAEIVSGGIALVPEGRRLFPTLTVEENL